MENILLYSLIIAASMYLISGFLFTYKGRITKKTIAFQYIWLIALIFLLSVNFSIKYHNSITAIIMFVVSTIVIVSIVYVIKYYGLDRSDKSGLSQFSLQELIERYIRKQDKH